MFLEVPLIRIRALFLSILAAALVLSACAPAAQATPAPAENADVNLQPVKDYSLTHAASLQSEAQALAGVADEYYTLIAAFDFDYAAAWAARSQELSALSAQAKQRWLAASTAYEVNEGIIAGVPSLAQFDVWIDAGPSGAEDPAEAYDWTLELPDGRKLEKPGNLRNGDPFPTEFDAHVVPLAVEPAMRQLGGFVGFGQKRRMLRKNLSSLFLLFLARILKQLAG